MASQETSIVNEIMKDTSKHGVRLFRNVRGMFYTIEGVKALISAAMSLNPARIKQAAQQLRMTTAGLLASGASDLIGFTPVIVTQEMVGQKIAIFTACEIKTADGRVAKEQEDFMNFVRISGGYAGIARSTDDARKIMRIPVDTPAPNAV